MAPSQTSAQLLWRSPAWALRALRLHRCCFLLHAICGTRLRRSRVPHHRRSHSAARRLRTQRFPMLDHIWRLASPALSTLLVAMFTCLLKRVCACLHVFDVSVSVLDVCFLACLLVQQLGANFCWCACSLVCVCSYSMPTCFRVGDSPPFSCRSWISGTGHRR